MRKLLVSGLFGLAAIGVAHADGTEGVKAKAGPAPLQTHSGSHHQSTHGAPTVHYGTMRKGVAVTTSQCGAGAVTCSGNYVVAGPAFHSEVVPAYVETVQPVIWAAGTYPGHSGHGDHHGSHYCTMDDCPHHKGGHGDKSHHGKPHKHHKRDTSTKLDGASFNGGVGANVGGYWMSGGNVVVVQQGYAGHRSVMNHPSARYTMQTGKRSSHTCCR